MNSQTSVLHWIYVLVMLLGSLTVLYLSRNPKKVPKIEYFIAFIIPIWSALAYMAIALGQGTTKVSNQITFYARYIDWIITTPLLLISLCLVAMYYVKKDKVLILSIVSADIIMVLGGLIADLSEGTNRYIWYFIGIIGFLISLWIIWIPLRKLANSQGQKLGKVYSQLAAYLTLFWIGYPTVWILGPSGLSIVSQQIDTYAFIILPMFSKVGFGLLSLYLLRKLDS